MLLLPQYAQSRLASSIIEVMFDILYGYALIDASMKNLTSTCDDWEKFNNAVQIRRELTKTVIKITEFKL